MTLAAAPVPMLARLARELPVGPYSYEPKWDGFRCLATVQAGRALLHSRHGRPLERYFPEIAEALGGLPVDAVLDGEIVIASPGGFDFAALLARMHPAPSRVERLRRETPASFVAFDVLTVGAVELTTLPFVARRERLEALLHVPRARVSTTPTTRNVAEAMRWLDLPAGSGIDGVVAKHDQLAYHGGRRAMVGDLWRPALAREQLLPAPA